MRLYVGGGICGAGGEAKGATALITILGAGVLAGALGAVVLTIGLIRQQADALNGPPRVGQPAPPLRLVGLGGKLYSLAGSRRHLVLVSFVCGCRECRRLARAWAPLRRSNPHLTLTAVTAMTAAEGRSFARAEAVVGPILLDPSEAVSTLWESTECPRCWIVEPSGKVTYGSRIGAPVKEILRGISQRLAAENVEEPA